MFNRYYLNHKFIEYDGFGLSDFVCEKCNMIIYHSKDILKFSEKYCIIRDDGQNGEIDDMPNITCEEYIIKNIIE